MPRFVPGLGNAAVVVVAAVLALNLVASGLGGPSAKDPRPEGIFADVGGWIAFGDLRGIWAVDPTGRGDPDSQVQLDSKQGTPKAWSPDGSKLLVLRDQRDVGHPNAMVLFVLNADGTETRLTQAAFRSGGDFTSDGARVVYAGPRDDGDGSNIYVIDAAGGTPEPLLAAGRRWVLDGGCPGYEGCVDGRRFLDTGVYGPTFSPDGTQIAYFDGAGDWGHSLRVMNSDGTGTRVVLENAMTTGAGHVAGLDWSPDGRHLVFALDTQGVYVVRIDGSGLTKVSSEGFGGADPHWSPDGSLISYNRGDPLGNTSGALVIARPDGTPVQEFDYGRSGPWNPR
jgi:Tol biopolymer transport system component